MRNSFQVRCIQISVLASGLFSIVVLLHWLVTQPALIKSTNDVLGQELAPFVTAVLSEISVANSSHLNLVHAFLVLTTLVCLASIALSFVLIGGIPKNGPASTLALSLAAGTASVVWFFFSSTHTVYRDFFGWTVDGPVRFVFDATAYFLGNLAPILLARFFLTYPKLVSTGEWVVFETERANLQRKDRVQKGNALLRWYELGLSKLEKSSTNGAIGLRSHAEETVSAIHFVRSPIVVGVVASLSLLFAAGQLIEPLHWATPLVRGMIVGYGTCALLACWGVIWECLRFNVSTGLPEDVRRIDWIRSTVMVGGWLVMATIVLCMFVVGPIWTNSDSSFLLPVAAFVVWPFVLSFEVFIAGFLVALAMSIFYRGPIDPRLAARKVSVLGVLGLLIAALFILIERTIAMKLAAIFGLSPDFGALIAGAAVTVSVAPIRGFAEKFMARLVGHYLPLESMISGDRIEQVVAISDLCGYTELSGRDEKQALLQAALFQRQAQRLVNQHGGRIVKSMGDAVMFTFDSAILAQKVLCALHQESRLAAEQLGIEPLQIHSGVHMGAVTIAHDGDIYGQTVNIAARIQGSALPGQIVTSDTYAKALSGSNIYPLEVRRFKNVMQDIPCFELK